MKKLIATLLTFSFALSCLSACSKSEETTKKRKKIAKKTTTEKTETETQTETETEPGDSSDIPDTSETPTDPAPTATSGGSSSPYTTLTLYTTDFGFDLPGDSNDIRTQIAEITGIEVIEQDLYSVLGTTYYNDNRTEKELVSAVAASGKLPDYIYTGESNHYLYELQMLVPWDDYLADPNYSNLRELHTDAQWELFRQDDGHIYWTDVSSSLYGEDRSFFYNDFAFWIQVRVLEWAGYPLITTLDQYFDLLEDFYEANPQNIDGTDVIPFTSIMEGWRYFAVDKPACLLDGHSDEWPVVVDTQNYNQPTVVDGVLNGTAEEYYRKMNGYYKRGLIDPDIASMSYDDYMIKIASGAVLGLSDEFWDFRYETDYFVDNGKADLGYNYVPLGLTLKEGVENHYYDSNKIVNPGSGVAVTTFCEDPDLAFQFMNRILEQDIHDLRFWGEESVDYLVDADGVYYQTPNMSSMRQDVSYRSTHFCSYDFLPHYCGTSRDGINAMNPNDWSGDLLSSLPEPVSRCFMAYGYDSYCDFLRSSPSEWTPWHPMTALANTLDSRTAGGAAYMMIQELKHQYLPQLILANDFDATWQKYETEYKGTYADDFIEELQEEVDRLYAIVG